MKRILACAAALALLVLTLCPALAATKVVEPGEDFYYLDTANVLSDETEGEIFFCNQLLYEQCGAQIVVAALDSIGRADIYEYAVEMGNSWGISSADKNNGFLLLMAIEEDDDSMLPDLESEFHSFEETLESMRLETLLTGEYDANNAILTFHAGAGGTEAQDWTSMLYRMYNMWAERHGYTVKLMDYLDGDEAGIKSATIMIEGENAYGFLKSENGIHRLVRISPFDASGRRHTSFAAVEVMPEITEDSEIELRDEDIKMDVYRSSGAGGQKVNKTSSAVRLTHIPTGIVVSSQVERSHFQNLENCKNMLRARLAEIKEREHLEKISDIKGVQMKIEWGSQIRSYVFMPYTLAKDHRTGYENGNIQAVMDGDLDGFINAYLSMNATSE